jgi:hypothetical protein
VRQGIGAESKIPIPFDAKKAGQPLGISVRLVSHAAEPAHHEKQRSRTVSLWLWCCAVEERSRNTMFDKSLERDRALRHTVGPSGSGVPLGHPSGVSAIDIRESRGTSRLSCTGIIYKWYHGSRFCESERKNLSQPPLPPSPAKTFATSHSLTLSLSLSLSCGEGGAFVQFPIVSQPPNLATTLVIDGMEPASTNESISRSKPKTVKPTPLPSGLRTTMTSY